MLSKFKTIYITNFQERTWGRVFITFEKQGKLFYAFKNWQKFEEFNYVGEGNIEEEPTFSWSLKENRFEFSLDDVLNGKADHLYLTPDHHKELYGTPSKILKRLLIDLKANNFEPVQNRRGWFERSKKPELVLSSIHVTKNYRQIVLAEYDFELKLEPLQKLVYLFFLCHPEGLTRTRFSDYEEELLSIYQKITTSTDLDVLKKRIGGLIDLKSNSLDEKISKIKKNLIDALGDKIALNYCISGQKNDVYKVNLPENLILFD